MTADLDLSGPTVTLFGSWDALGEALRDELGRRGCSTHSITVPMGWLASATQAVIRVDTPSGERAIRELAERDAPLTHVVAVCETSADDVAARRLRELCRRCSKKHDVSLIWHPPLNAVSDVRDPAVPALPADLATTISDEIDLQQESGSTPTFATQTFRPRR